MTDVQKTATTPRPPVAAKHPRTIVQHGRERVDDYAWLRAENWRDVMRDPSALPDEIRAHLEAENAYVKAWLADTETLQETLFQEMKGRIKEDDSSVPARDGPYAYYSRHRTGGQYPILARKALDPKTREIVGEEHILFDGDREAEGHEYFDLGGIDHSPDHKLLAYTVDLTGSERFEIRFRDIAAGSDLPDRIPESAGGFVWANDSQTIFWVERDEESRPRRVRRHRLGADPAQDPVIYEESDPGFFVSVSKTESDRFIIIDAHDHTTSEARIIEAGAPETAPRLVAPRDPGVEYDITDWGDEFLIHTNEGDAIDFKIMTAPVATPGREHWRPWLEHRPGVLILGMSLFKRHLVRLERVEGLPRIIIRRLADGAEHEISFAEEAYALGLGETLEFDTNVIRFGYASPTTPDQVFDYDMETRERTLLKTREVPSGHDPSHYVARRIFADAPDGERVPVTILHHVDTPIDGAAPALLYGYGSYGISIGASFSTGRLSLVDRGMVFAVAHVRGGKDKGYAWYLEGKRAKKANTFTDFIAAGEALIAQGYTARGKIISFGGSAGGLLVGATLNRAPDLFGGVVAAVPFVDVLNTMSDETLPLTPPEWPEWGNPIESAEDFEIIASYSPYENIVPADYPPVLITAGVSDPRVTYWEPAKWVARLREVGRGGPFLFKVNMGAGHQGASGRWDALKETTLEYAFVLKVAGLAEVAPKR
jgi:oligopeptidase B